MAYLTSLFFPVSTVITGYDSSVSNTTQFSNFLRVKPTPGVLYTVTGFTTASNMQYIHIYNSASYPPAGPPVSIAVVPEFSNFNISFNAGLPCSNGILVACSTTPLTFNAAASGVYFTAVYK